MSDNSGTDEAGGAVDAGPAALIGEEVEPDPTPEEPTVGGADPDEYAAALRNAQDVGGPPSDVLVGLSLADDDQFSEITTEETETTAAGTYGASAAMATDAGPPPVELTDPHHALPAEDQA